MEDILTNIDIVRKTCRFLKYNDEITFSKVSSSLNDIIINFVWRTKFEEVEIMVYKECDYIVTNRIDENKTNNLWKNCNGSATVHLYGDEINTFLYLNRNNIKKLKVILQSTKKLFLQQDLNNLRYLDIKIFNIRESSLRCVANHCKNLETIKIEFYYNHNTRTLLLNKDYDLQIFKTMHNLKNLELFQYRIKDNKLIDSVRMINKIELKQLALHHIIGRDNNIYEYQLNIHEPNDYKVFLDEQIERIFGGRHLFHFEKNFLAKFENLCALHLTNEIITNEMFNTLRNSCPNIIQLLLVNCQLRGVTAVPTLQKISFRCCVGLSFQDINTILNEVNLKSFSTIRNSLMGDFETLSIPPTLTHFHIVSCSQNINNLFEFNSNIKFTKLIKLGLVTYCCDREISLKFAPNLQELCIDLPMINITDFLQLKHLKKLFISICFSNEMSKLEHVLKHEKLTDLYIKDYILVNNVFGNLKEIVPTNLRRFHIPFLMMKREQDFVLDLLSANPKLSLKCDVPSIASIEIILLNAKFPKRFKSVNICGLSIDCDSILDESEKYKKVLELFHNNFYFVLE